MLNGPEIDPGRAIFIGAVLLALVYVMYPPRTYVTSYNVLPPPEPKPAG